MKILERFHINEKFKLLYFADIIINDMSIRRNDVVMVHTFFNNFKQRDFNPEDLIYLLKMIIGTGGTLLIPKPERRNVEQNDAHVLNDKYNPLHFNDQIYEVFLQMPDTITGTFPGYTLAAWGKHSIFLTEFGNYTESGPGRLSLGHKLNQLKAKFIGFTTPDKEFSFMDFSDHKDRKTAVSDNSNQVNNESFVFFTKQLEENENKILVKRGISFFRVNI